MINCEITVSPRKLLGRVEADIDERAKHAVAISEKIDQYKKELEGTGLFEASGQRTSEVLLVYAQQELANVHEDIRQLKDVALFLDSAVDEIAKVSFQI